MKHATSARATVRASAHDRLVRPARRGWRVPGLAVLGAVLALQLSACQSLPIGQSAQPSAQSQAQPSTKPSGAQPGQAQPASRPAQATLPVYGLPQGRTQPSSVPPVAETGRTLPSLVPFLTGRAAPPLPKAAPVKSLTAPPLPPSQAVRVAVLLPLSGPNAELGRAMLNAAELALFDFADNRFELLIHDTRGTTEGAEESARIAIGEGARLILGPLLASNVRAVAPQARAANVPVIAFSSDRTITGNGIYTMGFFPEAEVARVVAYAAAKGKRRFAGLLPDNPYGRTVADALKRAAELAGGEVTRLRFYNPRATDYAGDVQEVSDYVSRRAQLAKQLAELQGLTDEVSMRARERLEKLETLGDLPFDALLLADGGRRLQAVAALLPFYDVDSDRAQILGTGQWDVPGLGAEPALLGGWFAAPDPAARKAFTGRYEKTFTEQTPRLATLTYDAVALACVLARSGDRPFSAQALTQASGFAGRDGIFRLQTAGEVERGLAVLKVERKNNRVISPAPKAFN